jgi:hypothetical protein
MKKIGKEVLFLPTQTNNPRNGEGTFARLNDGRIVAAYTHYYGDDWHDHAIARICAVYSSDEGETWSEPTVLLEKDPEAQNIMSPSLIRLANGDLGMIYLRKFVMPDTGITCMPVFVSSSDEGKSWSEPIHCQIPDGYYCVINDGVTVLRNGRILVPASYYGIRYDAFHTCTLDLGPRKGGVVYIAYSDDNGKTWDFLTKPIRAPYEDRIGLAEPGIYEYENSELWVYCRTAYGHQYQSFSKDNGINWSTPAPNFCFTSPDAPMRVKKVGEYTVAAFNPFGFNCINPNTEEWGSPKRTPLLLAVSKDDGRSFDTTGKTPANGVMKSFMENLYYIEDDRSDSYCYPAIIGTKDGLLVSYYHSNGTGICLNSMKIVKIKFDELS